MDIWVQNIRLVGFISILFSQMTKQHRTEDGCWFSGMVKGYLTILEVKM